MGQEPSPTSEFVWQYFTVGEDKEIFLDKLPAPSSPAYLKATCTVCDTTLKRGTDRKTLTTYPLKRHLQTLHPNVWEGLNQYLEQKTRRGGAFPNSISSDNEKIEEVDPLTSPSTFNARTKCENNEKIEKMTTNTPTSTIQIRATSEFAWQYFTILENDPSKVYCNVCGTTISRGSDPKKYGVHPLKRHLRSVHENIWGGKNHSSYLFSRKKYSPTTKFINRM